MNTTRKNVVTAAVGSAIATVAAAALLLLGAGTAQAIGDVENVPSITSGTLDPGGEVGIIIINSSENRPGPRDGVGNPNERLPLSPESLLGPHVKTGP